MSQLVDLYQELNKDFKKYLNKKMLNECIMIVNDGSEKYKEIYKQLILNKVEESYE